MKTFFLGDLIPGRIQPNYESLAFLTQVWKNHGSFESLEELDNPTVINLNGVMCLGRGNSRATWLALNGFNFIRASEKQYSFQENESPEIIRIRKRFDELRLKRRIYNIYDLAALVQNPDDYRL
jgi:hypothetical protein